MTSQRHFDLPLATSSENELATLDGSLCNEEEVKIKETEEAERAPIEENCGFIGPRDQMYPIFDVSQKS